MLADNGGVCLTIHSFLQRNTPKGMQQSSVMTWAVRVEEGFRARWRQFLPVVVLGCGLSVAFPPLLPYQVGAAGLMWIVWALGLLRQHWALRWLYVWAEGRDPLLRCAESATGFFALFMWCQIWASIWIVGRTMTLWVFFYIVVAMFCASGVCGILANSLPRLEASPVFQGVFLLVSTCLPSSMVLGVAALVLALLPSGVE